MEETDIAPILYKMGQREKNDELAVGPNLGTANNVCRYNYSNNNG